MQASGNKHILALKFNFLTKLYDPLIKIVIPENLFKNTLIEQANILSGHRVLDFGCGTGTLTIMAKIKSPESTIIGIDVDEKIIGIAKKKIARQRLNIEIDKYDGNAMPYENESFDKVISSLVFHHLIGEQKGNILKEIYRILKPNGEIHIADFGRPRNRIMKLISYFLQLFEPITDNIKGLIPDYLKTAGFIDVGENKYFNTVFGTLALYNARKP
ncbi:MAG: class I SAM-dependent methyltransferase [Nitrospinota bacterium]